ncbi:hypothetical protein G4Y79_10280 [Phototrophicus methaneseepsis]|uniref:Uncharacterized protein n=1 Tax=Phototrophicus methaneseepsis TaxID=2710758 RepID=A0A7S8ED17_9CHLR|nr:hypothetical protein [Phototrophicus methaneseepsis]QPC84740.1 hypothetical protein G4Y79_10280 [Phototrophicus methaneseepsis]
MVSLPLSNQPWARALFKATIAQLWSLLPEQELQLEPSPGNCLYILQQTARPNVKRLEFRDLFAQGRRYFFQPGKAQSFKMTTTRIKTGYYRRRMGTYAVLHGHFDADDDNTNLHLRAHIRGQYALEAIVLPIFFSSLIIYMPWPPAIIIAMSTMLFVSSWFGHRYHAALEAHAMLVFIRKALADHVKAPALQISNEGGDIVYKSQRQFQQAWDEFYEEKIQQPL